jgi:eukaryotic-like serine/threonine-protein kinase
MKNLPGGSRGATSPAPDPLETGDSTRPGASTFALPPQVRAALSERGVELESELGRGAMSVVYRAADRRHAREVAVKLLDPAATPPSHPGALAHEVQLAAGLQHPYILPIYESGEIDGTAFFVMPYVEGESLRHRLERGRLPVDDAVRIAVQVAHALRYAHSHGVVHRDIKPENILLADGHAVVADFGVAARLADPGPAEPGVAVGTPAYMSPEQASGEPVFDGRSDLYALACMLYEMLAGQPPFAGDSPKATVARRFLGPPIPVRQWRPEVPEPVASVVEKALAIDPADRYPSAADFAEALAAARRRAGAEASARGRGVQGVAFGAAAVLVIMAALLGLKGSHGARPARLDPRRVAVAALSNETGDTTLTPVGDMVAAWITDRLSRVAGIEVVTSATVVPAQHDAHLAQSPVDDPARLHLLAAETRSGTLVSGSYYRGARGTIEFHVEVTDANSGRLLRAVGPTVTTSIPERAAATLGPAVAATVDSLIVRRARP